MPDHNPILTQAIANSPRAAQRYIAELEAENERLRDKGKHAALELHAIGQCRAALAAIAALAERHGGEDREIAGAAERN